MTQTETLFEMPSEYAVEAPSDPVEVPAVAGVCHACGRPTRGFTNACRSCQWKGCEATTMEDER